MPRAALIQFALVVAIFGAAAPVIQIGLVDATPTWFAFWRAVLAAGATALLVGWREGGRVPARADLAVVFAVGVCQIGAFFALLHLALTLVPAGRATLLAYTTQLWLVPISAFALGERPGPRRLLAVALGLAGIVVLADPVAAPLAGVALLLGASFFWAVAIAVLRASRPAAPLVSLLPWQFALAALVLLPAAVLLEPAGGVRLTAQSVAALAFLGVFGGPVATWAASSVSRALPALVASVGFLGVPLVSLAISVAVLGEPVTRALAVGGGLILSALLILAVRRQARAARTRRSYRRPAR
ncbi:DMT family transporter [Elioraea sp. Yellowstone]|jgi:drug/metabolite transporter (DMT)-like permease|uniref:DMT family transporter n=1 Tax=Elioraea sp. Yellowstone TaxID=2592070 RepID=UPI001153C0A7|nr:DMT family transporter [Elioraea sp. Yellowstone]TQF81838.1 DMT family transporter [Elioraea sp. Yellowstone]